MKIKLIEDEEDLETIFNNLVNDKNWKIEWEGLAIVWNFSIDFPAMILQFKEFIPTIKDRLLNNTSTEIRLWAIKILKNLLFPGHIEDIFKRAEKLIFESFQVKELYDFLDDEDNKIREQAVLIFKYLWQTSQKRGESDDEFISIIDSIGSEEMKDRISKL